MALEKAFPVGRYVGKEIDPNAIPFMLSIGYPEEVATKYGSHSSDMTFSRTGEHAFVLNISQPKINRNVDVAFTLDEPKISLMPSGKTMTSLFRWVSEENALKCEYSNIDGIQWTVNYQFRPNGVEMNLFSDFPRTIGWTGQNKTDKYNTMMR